jgi:hypothetical protein
VLSILFEDIFLIFSKTFPFVDFLHTFNVSVNKSSSPKGSLKSEICSANTGIK